MSSRGRILGLLLAAASFASSAAAQAAGGDDRHCPRAVPTNSNLFFSPKSNTGADRELLASLGETLARRPQPICILALLDPDEPAHSKKLALRRVVWIRQGLLAKGVPVGVIAEEFRLGSPEQGKDDFRMVNVIVGR